MAGDFAGLRVAITGAGSGIGLEVASQLSHMGQRYSGLISQKVGSVPQELSYPAIFQTRPPLHPRQRSLRC